MDNGQAQINAQESTSIGNGSASNNSNQGQQNAPTDIGKGTNNAPLGSDGQGGPNKMNNNFNNNPNTSPDTSNINSLIDKGNSLYRLGMYNEAITYFDKALAIDPNYKAALNNKGTALNSLGK